MAKVEYEVSIMKRFAYASLAPMLALLFCWCLAPVSSFAQTITATATGTVTDPNGAVVPGATVTATSNDTSLVKTATTDSEGRYTVPFLQPGAYSIAVDATGFGRTTRSDIRLEVAQTATLDFTLTVGTAETVVEVADTTTPLLITESSGLETTIENKLIEDLPSAQRSTLAFINLVPGAIDNGFSGAAGSALNTNGNAAGPIGSPGNRNFFDSNFSLTGSTASTNDILLDGVANTIGDFNGIAISPPQDSVREFKALSGAISAEFGRTGGGIVNIVTRAGTRDINGSLYEYFQNGGLNANGWQRNRAGSRPDGTAVLPRIPIKRNQFGGAIGGPVLLPRFGEGGPAFFNDGATFFFFNYEGRRELNPFSSQVTLPSERQRRGDLSELLTGVARRDAAGNAITNPDGTPAIFGQIYDPYAPLVNGLRRPIPGNRLDLLPACGAGPRTSACLDPVAQRLFTFLPLPTQSGLASNYAFSDTATFDRNIYAARIDKTISERQNFFGRFSYEKRVQAEPNFFESPAANARQIIDTFYNTTFNHVFSFTNSIVNNFRYGYTRAKANQQPYSAGFDITTLGLPSSIRDRAVFPAFPIFNFGGGAGLPGEISTERIGGSGNNQPRDTQTFADAVTIIRGAHTIKTGGEYRLYRFFAYQFNNPSGTFNFNRVFTQGPTPGITPAVVGETGSSLATLLLGLPSGVSIEIVQPLTVYRHYGAGFVQDDYKVTRNLTLNLGLRWDTETGVGETHGLITNFDLDAASPLAGRVSQPTDSFVRALRPSFTDIRGVLGFVDGTQTEANKNRFAPRIGFAYSVNNRTTVRGGYGIFYLPLSVEATTAQGNNFTINAVQSPNPGQVVQPGGGASPTIFLSNPFPSGLPELPGSSLGANTLIGQSVFAVEPRRRTAYNQTWNLVVQRELARNLVVDVGYVGSHGVRLPLPQVNLNQLPPEYLDAARAAVPNPTAANLTAFFNQQIPNPFFGVITNPNSALRNSTVTRLQLLKPFPQYDNVTLFRPHLGASKYHALQFNLQKRFSDGLSAIANYTFSKFLDIASAGNNSGFLPGNNTSIENVYDLAGEYAPSNADVPHRFVASFSYELPFGRGRRFGNNLNRLANVVLGGFQLSGTATYQSGSPFPIVASGFPVAIGAAARRPNRVTGVEASIPLGDARENVRNGGVWFNTDAFLQPLDYTFGNAARNYSDVRRDAYRNVDLSVLKNFQISEDNRLQFRAEFLNAFNLVVFGTPGNSVNTAPTANLAANPSGAQGFGQITTQGNTPRVIQFVLRYTY